MIYRSLIIIRGNSASGKSTVAKKLREVSDRKIAYVEQDNIRRTILKEKETDAGVNIALIAQVVEFALSRDYDVILEGMLKFRRYGAMLRDLIKKCPENYTHYFDIPFEETLKRHVTKSIAGEVSKEMLHEWYEPQDFAHFESEKIIPAPYSVEQSVQMIVKNAGL
ncbi:MAG TPA: AAA family ATPase [Candidatus Saccharimonadales bacterium]|jgi:adenylate kinase family enzyme